MVDARKLTVESWPLERVLPYAANARLHPPEQVAQLVTSIREFGFNQPVLVDASGVLVAGHGRLLAAARLQMAEVPVIRLGHLTDAEARAYRLADNRIALNSEWDEDLLASELAAVADKFDLEGLGFGADEIDALFSAEEARSTEAREGEDAMPVPMPDPAVLYSAPGDVWICGPHRVMCGDAAKLADVQVCLGREEPHLLVTDAVRPGLEAVFKNFKGAVAYVFHHPLETREVLVALSAAEFEHRSMIVWVTDEVDPDPQYALAHRQCWYVVRKGETGHWNGARDQSTAWSVPPSSRFMPVECMRRPLLNNAVAGDAVYDPFLAGGSTLLAAETVGCRCFGLEPDPYLVDLAVARWQLLSGSIAVRESDGRPFGQGDLARAA